VKDPPRARRLATRWLERWLAETPGVTSQDAALAAAALGGSRGDAAYTTLRALLTKS
jgi:hypothetical protein